MKKSKIKNKKKYQKNFLKIELHIIGIIQKLINPRDMKYIKIKRD